jgi:hypothetical protein
MAQNPKRDRSQIHQRVDGGFLGQARVGQGRQVDMERGVLEDAATS